MESFEPAMPPLFSFEEHLEKKLRFLILYFNVFTVGLKEIGGLGGMHPDPEALSATRL